MRRARIPSVQTIKQTIERLTRSVQTFRRSFMQHERMFLTVLATERNESGALCSCPHRFIVLLQENSMRIPANGFERPLFILFYFICFPKLIE